MKSTIEQLSASDRKALVLFYGTDPYKALRKLIDLERIELAKDTADLNGTMEQIAMQNRYLTGQGISLKRLAGTLTQIYKENKD